MQIIFTAKRMWVLIASSVVVVAFSCTLHTYNNKKRFARTRNVCTISFPQVATDNLLCTQFARAVRARVFMLCRVVSDEKPAPQIDWSCLPSHFASRRVSVGCARCATTTPHSIIRSVDYSVIASNVRNIYVYRTLYIVCNMRGVADKY